MVEFKSRWADWVPAETAKLNAAVTHWLTENPPSDPGSDICAACGNAQGREDGVPILAGERRRVWVHHHCYAGWVAQRRAEAVAAIQQFNGDGGAA